MKSQGDLEAAANAKRFPRLRHKGLFVKLLVGVLAQQAFVFAQFYGSNTYDRTIGLSTAQAQFRFYALASIMTLVLTGLVWAGYGLFFTARSETNDAGDGLRGRANGADDLLFLLCGSLLTGTLLPVIDQIASQLGTTFPSGQPDLGWVFVMVTVIIPTTIAVGASASLVLLALLFLLRKLRGRFTYRP